MTNLNIFETPIRIDMVFSQDARKEAHVKVMNHERLLFEGSPGDCVTKIRRMVQELQWMKEPRFVFYIETAGDEYPYFDYDKAEMKSRLTMMSVSAKCHIEVRSRVNTRF